MDSKDSALDPREESAEITIFSTRASDRKDDFAISRGRALTRKTTPDDVATFLLGRKTGTGNEDWLLSGIQYLEPLVD